MSDSHIEPTSPIAGVRPVRPIRRKPGARPAQRNATPPAATGGSLRAAYSELHVDPDTQEMVVRVRDAATDEMLSELPAKEIHAMDKHLKDYADAAARYRAALLKGSGN
jgi:hypothetical protein